MPYIGNQIALEDTQDRKSYTGDGSRTVFGITFSDNLVQVYQNGILLKETNDYTVSGGTITLDSNLTVAQNDIVDVKIFSTFMSDSAMPQTGGQFYKFGVPQYNNVSNQNNTVEIATDKGMGGKGQGQAGIQGGWNRRGACWRCKRRGRR